MTAPTSRRLVVLVLALAAVVAFSSTSTGATRRVRAAGSVGNWTWNPDFRHIVRGNRIVWKNPTNVTHRVVAYSSNWSKNTSIAPGERTRKKFRRRGRYLYRCTVPGHSSLSGTTCSGMCGEIHVTRR